MKYNIEYKENLITIDQALEFYNINKVSEYCKECTNYSKIWSCPPHDFNPKKYLKSFNKILIVSGKIVLDKKAFTDGYKSEINEVFQIARREFGNKIILLEDDYNNSEALIAGNCFQCNKCKRETNEKCILKNNMRYSLEALGLMVSEITSKVLEQEIIWIKDEVPDYLLTVGGLLMK